MNVITDTDALAALCDRLSSADYVTVDTEFMRDSTFWPVLCLIQLAGPRDEIIIDPLAPDIDLATFYALMKNRKVVRIGLGGRADSVGAEGLARQLGVVGRVEPSGNLFALWGQIWVKRTL